MKLIEGCPNIKHVGVSGSYVTDEILEKLGKLQLTSLDLSFSNNITDDGLAYLEGMPLTSLKLKGCYRISDAGLAHLREMFPGLGLVRP